MYDHMQSSSLSTNIAFVKHCSLCFSNAVCGTGWSPGLHSVLGPGRGQGQCQGLAQGQSQGRLIRLKLILYRGLNFPPHKKMRIE